MWSVNAKEMLENEAWKPGWVTFVLFARRLPLGKGGERGLEGALRAESEFQVELASVSWPAKWVNQACPSASAGL